MQIYLVGGAVRDRLLGLPVEERDWVVIGATPEQMLAQGFQPVGKEFPVFLHPDTHEEYALARTERKVDMGYKGFTFHADPSVTLEQDLQRRDLTINAIAEDRDGHLIDPFHGQDDLTKKTFRHVSIAFQEDPVRILRVARLACKLTQFRVHPSTQQLMQNMVAAGEVDALVAERVWQEFHRALSYAEPERFFAILHGCGALATLFPAITYNNNGIQCLQQAPQHLSPLLRFALLTHDFPANDIKTLVKRYRIPSQYAELALLVNHHLKHLQKLNPRHAHEVLTLLVSCDALRRKARFFDFLQIATFIIHQDLHEKIEPLKKGLAVITAIDTTPLQREGVTGKDFAHRLTELRLNALENMLSHP